MKDIVSLLLFITLVISGFSQENFAEYGEYQAFLKTKTLVVLEDNPFLEYNFDIRKIIPQEWKITGYDFISYKEFKEKRSDPDYSFLILTEVTFEKDRSETRYNFLNLLLGGNYRTLSDMPDLALVPLSYPDVDEDRYLYKLNGLVRFIQNHVTLVLDHPEILGSNVYDYYKKNTKDMKDKTLYLLVEEIVPEFRSAEKIRGLYPYKFRLVKREEIKKAIINRDTNVVFLHKVGPEGTMARARCFKIMIGAGDAIPYYFDYHMIDEMNRDGLLESDFRKMINPEN